MLRDMIRDALLHRKCDPCRGQCCIERYCKCYWQWVRTRGYRLVVTLCGLVDRQTDT